MAPLRVLHVPARTPYARKLHDASVRILNGTTEAGLAVPRDATLAWLLEHRPWHWLDIVHLHHLDFEPLARLRAVLSECRRVGKRVVFTAHDLQPIFSDRVTHHRTRRLLADHGVPFVCLTPAAQAAARHRFAAHTTFVPYGYVTAPGTLRRRQRESGPTRFLIYGSLRRNRDVEQVLACWRFARQLADTTLHLLLRAPSHASLTEDGDVWRIIREHTVDPRLRVEVLPFPTDSEVNEAVAGADCLLLPYRWVSHSGQLEHALDLGVLPVAPLTGYLPDQVALHGGLAPEPVWFDWSNDVPFDHGARLLEALCLAHRAVQDGWRAQDADKFADHRRLEHGDVMAAHRALYGGAK